MIKTLIKALLIVVILAIAMLGITEYQYYESLSSDAKQIYRATRIGW